MKKKSEFGILGQPHLRRRQLREERQRHAVALPAQRLGEHPQEQTERRQRSGCTSLDVHRRGGVLQDHQVHAALPDGRHDRLRPRQRHDQRARRPAAQRTRTQVAEQAEPLAHRHDAAAPEVRARRGAGATRATPTARPAAPARPAATGRPASPKRVVAKSRRGNQLGIYAPASSPCVPSAAPCRRRRPRLLGALQRDVDLEALLARGLRRRAALAVVGLLRCVAAFRRTLALAPARRAAAPAYS